MFGLRDLLLLAPSSTSLDISQPIFSHHLNNTTTTTTNNNNNTVGVIPLLPATYLEDTNFDGNSRETRMRLWSQSQSQQQAQQTNQNQQSQQQHHKRPMDNSGGSGALVPIFINNSGSSNNTSCSISGIACQDCGNQAKKDCSYRRCRTCCKSRAFGCSTHIKSTWVPASRRRERQQQQQQQQHQEQNQEQSQLFTKKPRTSQTTSHTSTSGTRSFDSTQQDSPLPGHVRAPAVFKCVRVTSIDDGDDEFAYQATVKIGGRVFKGFLYDQGVDGGGEGIPNLSDLHLGAAVSSSSSPPVVDPSSSHVYGGGMMGGSGYENQMN